MKFEFLNSTNGEQSSKRLFTFILIVLWVVYFFANLFWGKNLSPTVENNLFYLILATFAGVTLEGWKSVFMPKQDCPPGAGTKQQQ